MGNELIRSGNSNVPSVDIGRHELNLHNERERIRAKLSRQVDKVLDTFEDIMDNSDDDKARNVAASRLAEMWESLNGVSKKLDLGPVLTGDTTVNNIQVNVASLRDVLGKARMALPQHTDEKIELFELEQEIADEWSNEDDDEDAPLITFHGGKKKVIVPRGSQG